MIDPYQRLDTRKRIYLSLLNGTCKSGLILVVGDKPGPSAPTDPGYHHTPFYSTKHCSGWMNNLLEEAKIPEDRLAWINVITSNTLIDVTLVKKASPSKCIALGTTAGDWLRHNGFDYIKQYHPQYWKRFRSSQPYPLIEVLQNLM